MARLQLKEWFDSAEDASVQFMLELEVLSIVTVKMNDLVKGSSKNLFVSHSNS